MVFLVSEKCIKSVEDVKNYNSIKSYCLYDKHICTDSVCEPNSDEQNYKVRLEKLVIF